MHDNAKADEAARFNNHSVYTLHIKKTIFDSFCWLQRKLYLFDIHHSYFKKTSFEIFLRNFLRNYLKNLA